jgi:glycosyltransferase involved in cell wall biosynthesis
MLYPKISAFVISYNRANILGTCLRGLAFADELIVVDKSSTDDSRIIAEAHADTVISVPWTPTVEETRTLALSLCRHEWILFMDDDECLSPGADRRIRAELASPRADIYTFPLRHYILGLHDERAYYSKPHSS